jgi:hypothetical protein
MLLLLLGYLLHFSLGSHWGILDRSFLSKCLETLHLLLLLELTEGVILLLLHEKASVHQALGIYSFA